MKQNGKIGRIGLVSSHLRLMIIVVATNGTAKTTVVMPAGHAETTSILGLTDQLKHIAIGETNTQNSVGIVEDCKQIKTGQRKLVKKPSSSYVKEV